MLHEILTGIGVSKGVVSAPALVIDDGMPDMAEHPVFVDDSKAEMARLDTALAAVKDRLHALGRRTAERAGPEEAKIFDAQVLMIEDEEFIGRVRRLIRDNHIGAERSFEFVALEQRELWLESSSPILRARVEDLSAVLNRVVRSLVGKKGVANLASGAELRVVVIRELTAGLTIEFDREQVVAFVSEEGTRASHAGILARSLGIPCVMGVAGALSRIKDGSMLLVDGASGTVTIHPDATETAQAMERRSYRRSMEAKCEAEIGSPAVTLDGKTVALRGNLDLPEELDAIERTGAQGIGLVRTEFLVLGRSEMPDEEDQYRYFSSVARRFPNDPVVIRSYDLGGDKFPRDFKSTRDANPFLGWRAIRVCLDRPELFVQQIRAVVRARLHGDVQLMLPLITGLEELIRSKELVAQAMAELRAEGVECASELPVGVMVETPAAVMMIAELAADCDFLSVGTNDLTQYTLAVDRSNARLADRFLPLHPALLRLLKMVVESAEKASVPLSVCGELASDPLGTLFLLGIGYDAFSMAPTGLPLARWLIRRMDFGFARETALAAAECRTVAEAHTVLSEAISGFPELKDLELDWLPVGAG